MEIMDWRSADRYSPSRKTIQAPSGLRLPRSRSSQSGFASISHNHPLAPTATATEMADPPALPMRTPGRLRELE